MPGLFYSHEAIQDLKRLRLDPERAKDADEIQAFTEEVDGDEEVLKFLTRSYHKRTYPFPQPRFDVKKIECFHENGYKIFRLASQRIEWTKRKYRIIYAHDTKLDECVILAIAKRKLGLASNEEEYDYEPDHPLTERIKKQYADEQIPRIN